MTCFRHIPNFSNKDKKKISNFYEFIFDEFRIRDYEHIADVNFGVGINEIIYVLHTEKRPFFFKFLTYGNPKASYFSQLDVDTIKKTNLPKKVRQKISLEESIPYLNIIETKISALFSCLVRSEKKCVLSFLEGHPDLINEKMKIERKIKTLLLNGKTYELTGTYNIFDFFKNRQENFCGFLSS